MGWWTQDREQKSDKPFDQQLQMTLAFTAGIQIYPRESFLFCDFAYEFGKIAHSLWGYC